MQSREVDAQVGHLQHVLDMRSVRILNVHVGRQNTENHLTVLGRFNARVSMVANNVCDILGHEWYTGEGIRTVMREIFIHMPGAAKIVRPFDEHGCRSEGGEYNDQMGKMELGFKIQLNGDVLLAIFRLPPRLFAGAWLRFINDLTDSMILQRIVFGRLSSVAQEAFLFFQMRDDAKSFRIIKTTRGRCV